MIFKITSSGLVRTGERMRRIGNNVKREMGTATERSTNMVAKVARKHLRVARRRNKQDHGGAAERLPRTNPVQRKVDKPNARGVVKIKPHWVRTRIGNTAELDLKITKHFTATQLKRKSLFLKRPKRRGGTQVEKEFKINAVARVTQYGKRGQKLKKKKRVLWLKPWAERMDRGRQIYKHVVRLRSPQALRELSATPTIKETSPIVVKIYRDHALKAVSK